jgi:hypothetical protein
MKNRPTPTISRLAEAIRLEEKHRRSQNWKRWGPYLSERQWGTVREDYSADSNCWQYFPHDHARSRAYRWGEDGLLGWCDRECRLCFALCLWNEKDPILKERLFGLTNEEGNHGEDVKECYFYLDATPTHSYQKALYKYPQAEFPYRQLVEENRRRSRNDPEFELIDTGIFNQNHYFDIFIEYAKGAPNDILIRITAVNRGTEPAPLHLLPTLWFRNTWSWGRTGEDYADRPRIIRTDARTLAADHESLGRFFLAIGEEANGRVPPVLFTENETNAARIFGTQSPQGSTKDAFHDYLVHSRSESVHAEPCGTKAAVHYFHQVLPGATFQIQLRLYSEDEAPNSGFGEGFNQIFSRRIREADEFYQAKLSPCLSSEQKNVARQAFAGLLWSKQFYEYVVKDWLEGDPAQPAPPAIRKNGRNHEWQHLHCRDVLIVPDKWEFPWFASWDNAFHMVTLAQLDPELAKERLILFLREWYMHPNGQIPACEFGFSDVNPPVQAWACWRVYKLAASQGHRDRLFLERVLQKLLINLTWWVNRKDVAGNNLFAGGFLGLDNIGFFDRSAPRPPGVTYEQADGTAWMAFYCLTMLAISLELAQHDPAYEDVASKFFEHFVAISDAINNFRGTGLWDDEDGFYYDGADVEGRRYRFRARSMVGLVPLFAVEVLENQVIEKLPGFRKRMDWLLRNRSELAYQVTYSETDGKNRWLLAIPSRQRLERILHYLFNEGEFLSPFGVRALSAAHKEHPYELQVPLGKLRVGYDPGESTTDAFGGNSNWRGPVWFPMNYLLVEALQRYHHFYGDTLRVECPTGSGQRLTLGEAAAEIAHRLISVFLPNEEGRRPCHGSDLRFASDPHWRGLLLFREYFHGGKGRGCGASHQTGWTAMITRLLHKFTAGCSAE